jgi:hypothetical protein
MLTQWRCFLIIHFSANIRLVPNRPTQCDKYQRTFKKIQSQQFILSRNLTTKCSLIAKGFNFVCPGVMRFGLVFFQSNSTTIHLVANSGKKHEIYQAWGLKMVASVWFGWNCLGFENVVNNLIQRWFCSSAWFGLRFKTCYTGKEPFCKIYHGQAGSSMKLQGQVPMFHPEAGKFACSFCHHKMLINVVGPETQNHAYACYWFMWSGCILGDKRSRKVARMKPWISIKEGTLLDKGFNNMQKLLWNCFVFCIFFRTLI